MMMKSLIYSVLIIFSYSLVFCEVDFELLEEAYTNCTRDNDITTESEELIKSYNFSQSLTNVQCYWKCFMETSALMSNGKILKEPMHEYLESQIVYGLYDKDDIGRLFDFCETAVVTKGESECEMSYELSKCIYLNLIGEKKIVGSVK